ncbi:MAG: hypothetical protein IJW43_02265 [Clostridia bacterium]|nr:hypothetical protein [Clostridia bacterium]
MDGRFESFTGLINKIAKSIRKIKTEEMSDFGIKSSHVSCVYYLYKQGDLTAGELCSFCDEDKASISRSVDFLQTNGYLEHENNGKKTYNKKLILTEKGKQLGEVISKKIDVVLSEVGSFMSSEERIVFYKTLSKISFELENITKNYGDK